MTSYNKTKKSNNTTTKQVFCSFLDQIETVQVNKIVERPIRVGENVGLRRLLSDVPLMLNGSIGCSVAHFGLKTKS